MKQEIVDRFISKYPLCFRELKGISCADSWELLLDNLFVSLEFGISLLPEEVRVQVYLIQVKSKFGSLRCYLSQDTPYLRGCISVAENMSSSICEHCGSIGKTRVHKGITYTMCETGFKELT